MPGDAVFARGRGGLRTRLLVAYLTPTVLALGVGGALSYSVARAALEASLGERLVAVAGAAAAVVSADQALRLEPGGEETRVYRNLRQKLVRLRDRTGIRAIAVFDRDGRVLVDADAAFRIGQTFPEVRIDRFELRAMFERGERVRSVLFRDTSGWFMTGYAPLQTEPDGEEPARVVGGVAVEGAASFYAALDTLGSTWFGLTALSLALVVLVTFLLSRRVVGPLQRLADAAHEIGRGAFDGPPPAALAAAADPRAPREIRLLAHAVGDMREALSQRDRETQMMLAGVAHEVRNPLGGIELYAGLLHEDVSRRLASDPDAAWATNAVRRVERIQKELGHLARIVEDFLQFARRTKVEPVDVDLAELVREVGELVGPEAAARGVRLTVDAASAVPSRCDAALVRRALLNLVKNAVQATGEGGAVDVACRRSAATPPASGREARVEIVDTGCGMSAEVLAQAFTPFFTTKEKGSGLGLPLARKIVELNGGRLELDSVQGRGTRVTVALPAREG